MIVSQATMDTLKAIGLNSYERKLWVALISRATGTAGELSELANVPRSRTYDVLESLAEKGFVMVQTTKPLRYVAIEPEESMVRAKDKLRKDFEDTAMRIDRLKGTEIMKELKNLFKTGVETVKPAEMTGALKGRHQFARQFETMVKNAKKNLNVVTSPQGLKELYLNHGDILENAAKRGVKIRIAAPFSDEIQEVINKLDFAEVRSMDEAAQTKNFAGRFAIADGKEILFALTHDEKVHPTQDLAIWSQSDHAAKDVMEPLFNMIWQQLDAN